LLIVQFQFIRISLVKLSLSYSICGKVFISIFNWDKCGRFYLGKALYKFMIDVYYYEEVKLDSKNERWNSWKLRLLTQSRLYWEP
jgi:hypothetical protein